MIYVGSTLETVRAKKIFAQLFSKEATLKSFVQKGHRGLLLTFLFLPNYPI